MKILGTAIGVQSWLMKNEGNEITPINIKLISMSSDNEANVSFDLQVHANNQDRTVPIEMIVKKIGGEWKLDYKKFLPVDQIKGRKNKVTTTEDSNLGVELYKTNCTPCHGEDGKKALGGATDLSTSHLNADEISDVVSNGKGNMPSYGNQLSEEEISSLATYLQSLKK